jgi:hypothetical protein
MSRERERERGQGGSGQDRTNIIPLQVHESSSRQELRDDVDVAPARGRHEGRVSILRHNERREREGGDRMGDVLVSSFGQELRGDGSKAIVRAAIVEGCLSTLHDLRSERRRCGEGGETLSCMFMSAPLASKREMIAIFLVWQA